MMFRCNFLYIYRISTSSVIKVKQTETWTWTNSIFTVINGFIFSAQGPYLFISEYVAICNAKSFESEVALLCSTRRTLTELTYIIYNQYIDPELTLSWHCRQVLKSKSCYKQIDPRSKEIVPIDASPNWSIHQTGVTTWEWFSRGHFSICSMSVLWIIHPETDARLT